MGLSNLFLTSRFSLLLARSPPYSRVQTEYHPDPYAVLPPGPPVGQYAKVLVQYGSVVAMFLAWARVSVHAGFCAFRSTFLQSLLTLSLSISAQIRLQNPFAFAFTVQKIAVTLAFDDVDGKNGVECFPFLFCQTQCLFSLGYPGKTSSGLVFGPKTILTSPVRVLA